ncbi:ABC transporter permease [bacterium]|nr:ABC transporter permease [bacterium]
MGAIDIAFSSLLFSFFLLAIPILLSIKYGFGLIKPLLLAVFRMCIQLVLIGIFLKYLFIWNNSIVNICWIIIMVTAAVFSVLKDSALRVRKVFMPVFITFFITIFSVVVYLNFMVIKLNNIFDAKYLIILSGMLLGSSLRGCIVGISYFYKSIKKDSKRFLYILALGADRNEVILPYLKESIQLALKPRIATMATMGIVALPGMMTGVILGGGSPVDAIKYQIMVMVSVVACATATVILSVLVTLKICFDKYGILQMDVFTDSDKNMPAQKNKTWSGL